MGQTGSGLSGPGVRGLKNLDSTCYMNVGLQCLFQTPGLTPVLSQQWKNSPRDIARQRLRGGNHQSALGGTSILQSYLELAERFWDSHGEQSCLSPAELKRTIDRLDPRYKGCSEQRDAVDFFLNVFIKHLHSDVRAPFIHSPQRFNPNLPPSSKKSSKPTKDNTQPGSKDTSPPRVQRSKSEPPHRHTRSPRDNRRDFIVLTKNENSQIEISEAMHQAAAEGWRNHLIKHGRSFFTENLQGQSYRRATCSACQKTTVDFPFFHFLPLAPPATQESVRFVDMFSRLPRRHLLSEWKCPLCGCNKPINGIEEKIWKLPNILMVLIHRVMRTRKNRLVKNKTEIWIPRTGLDLSSLTLTKGIPSPVYNSVSEDMKGEKKKTLKEVVKSTEELEIKSEKKTSKEKNPQKETMNREKELEEEVLTKEKNPDKKSDGNNMAYNVYAILAHTGTPNRGHYVAHVRNVRSRRWHTLNDGKICPYEVSNVIKSSNVYALFFERSAFAKQVEGLRIPGEPITFREWKENMAPKTKRSGFGFIANSSIRLKKKI